MADAALHTRFVQHSVTPSHLLQHLTGYRITGAAGSQGCRCKGRTESVGYAEQPSHRNLVAAVTNDEVAHFTPNEVRQASFHTRGPLQKRLSGVDTGPACSTGHVRTAHGRLAWPQVRQHKERQLGKVMGGQRRRVRSRDVLRWGALPVLPPRT